MSGPKKCSEIKTVRWEEWLLTTCRNLSFTDVASDPTKHLWEQVNTWLTMIHSRTTTGDKFLETTKLENQMSELC